MVLVDLARFERATSTFAESRSDSAELQVPVIVDFQLPIADCRFVWGQADPALGGTIGNWQLEIGNVLAEMERFERSQDFSRHLSGVLPCQLGDISKMAEGYGVEPYTVISRRSFQDCLTHSTVGPSVKIGRDARI